MNEPFTISADCLHFLALLSANPGFRVSELARTAGMTESNGHYHAKELVRKKLIRNTGVKNKPVYEPTERGLELISTHSKNNCPLCGRKAK